MIDTILFPTDFSDNAQNALFIAIDLAKKNKSKLFITHIYEVPLIPPANIFSTREKTMLVAKGMIVDSIKKRMDALIERSNLEGVEYDFFIQEGNTEKLIKKIVKDYQIDIIVMGTKGETAARELFMGSVTKKLIQQARCPVLAIPGDYTSLDISNIVYTTDLEDDETNAVNYLVRVAELFNADLTLLHFDYNNKMKTKHLEKLKEIADQVSYDRIKVEDVVVFNLIEGIETYVKNNNVNMLAITTKTTTFLNEIFHKSIMKEVLFHTHIPILAFNRKNKDFILF